MPDLTTKEALLERMVTATENLKTNVPAKFDNYLPLSGGTMTGSLLANITDWRIGNVTNAKNGTITIRSCNSSYKDGAQLIVYGADSNGAGSFYFQAGDGTNTPTLQGLPDGTLKWAGQPIQTSSDKRLKQDFSDVPADVLKAWGKVEWKQFKFIADAERKGADNCRWHTGLVAQDVKEIGEKNKVDLCKYGILCHDVREAVEEEKDENGNVIREASEAVDLWTVRYEEALAMEVIYLRNEIKKLQSEIRKLKKA